MAVVRVAHLRKHKQVERKNEELTGHGDPLPVFLHTVGKCDLRGASEARILASGLVRNFVRMGIEDACVGEPCELPSSVYPKDLVHEILAGLEALCVGLDLEGLLLLLRVHLCCWRSPCLPLPPLVPSPRRPSTEKGLRPTLSPRNFEAHVTMM